jgi:hypothetical protein
LYNLKIVEKHSTFFTLIWRLTVSGLLDELQTSEAELRGELERLPVVFFADKTGKG